MAECIQSACMQSECMQSECTICLFNYTEETKKTLKCNHIFHKECLDKWLQTNNKSCPLCRTEINPTANTVPCTWNNLLDLHSQRSRFAYGRRQFHKK